MKRQVRIALSLAMAVGAANPGLAGPEGTPGAAVVRQMHDRYEKNWYDTLTFTQKSTTHSADGASSSEIWQEAMMLPGTLRIDVGPLENGNGALVSKNTLTRFKDGKVSATRPFVHLLLVLGFDVYRQPPPKTLEQLKGFDLGSVREDTWNGTAVYVVGAAKGDLRSKQFWIEKARLFFVRLIQPDDKDPTKTSDTRFGDYRQLPVGWVATRVDVLLDGKEVFTEEYSDVQANPKLDPAIFDPGRFASSHWEK